MQVIKPKRSEVANDAPTAGQLATHEMAVNVTDQKVYMKDSGGSVQEVANVTFTDAEKLALELEREYKLSNLSYFKEITYASGAVSNVSIYTDSGKGTKLFNKDFTYSGNEISQTVLTRITDSKTLTRDFTFSGGDLISIDTTAS